MLSLYHVKFLSPFHSGTFRGAIDETDNIIHSDTLAAAIIDQAGKLGADVKDFARELKISSIFYCYKTGREINYLVPRPTFLPDVEVSKLKELKKIEFIPVDQLGEWLNGRVNPEYYNDLPELYKENTLINAVIDRETGAATPFSRAGIQLNKGVLGYFLADTDQADLLNASLKLIEHGGIGGDRSTGMGQVEIAKIDQIPNLFKKKNNNLYYSLSLYKPTSRELSQVNQTCFYGLTKRSSWFKKGELTNRYTFFQEGSVFNFKIEGMDIEFHTPSKKIIKGKPLFLEVA